MRNPSIHAKLVEEARVLYTLLDAADCSGLIKDPDLRKRIGETRRRAEVTSMEQEAEAMRALLDELERNGVIAGSWIQRRWRALMARAEKP